VPHRANVLAWAAGALALGVAIGFLLWGTTDPRGARAPVKRLTINLPSRVALAMSPDFRRPMLALSPDGSKLVYAAISEGAQDLYLRRLDLFETTRLSGTSGADLPFFSPDGQWVGFFQDGNLRKVSLEDGQVVDLARLSWLPAGAAWSDGGTIFLGTQAGILTISEEGGDARVSTEAVNGDALTQWPVVLPGDRFLLFSRDRTRAIHLWSLETGEESLLVENAAHPRDLSSGHILFERDNALFVVPFDSAAHEVTGAPRVVSDSDFRRQSAVSSEGTLAYVELDRAAARELVWVDRWGTVTLVSEFRERFLFWPVLSPNGNQLALTLQGGPHPLPEVWTYDFERSNFARVTTTGNAVSIGPTWSPDGRRIYFESNRDSSYFRPFVQAVDGTGEAELLLDSESGNRTAASLSSNGSILILVERNDDTGQDIGMLRLDAGREHEMLLETAYEEKDPRLSPDDRFLAYVSNESGGDDVYVATFPSLGGKQKVSSAGGVQPVWSRDGRELFYFQGNRLMSVAVDGDTFGRPEPLFTFDRAAGTGYDVSPDGSRFLMIREEGAPLTEIQIVLNWNPDEERLR
jgi:serine/threonine-protein kinase